MISEREIIDGMGKKPLHPKNSQNAPLSATTPIITSSWEDESLQLTDMDNAANSTTDTFIRITDASCCMYSIMCPYHSTTREGAEIASFKYGK